MSLIRARYRAVNTIMNLPRGGGYVGLLDLFPNAAAAYSLRKLRAAYSGAAVRVRRSSDNTEQDIGFTAQGELDTASLLSFVNADVTKADTDFSTGFADTGESGLDRLANQSIGGRSGVLKGTIQATIEEHRLIISAVDTAANTHRIQTSIYIPSGQSGQTVDGFRIENGGFEVYATTTTKDAWVDIDVTWTSVTNSNIFIKFLTLGGAESWLGNGTDEVYIGDVTITQTTADGLVSTWYDQSLSNDATQTTAANQPMIVSAGSLVTENGKAAIDYNSSGYLLANFSGTLSQPNTIFSVCKKNDNSAYLFDGVSGSNRHAQGSSDWIFAGNVLNGAFPNPNLGNQLIFTALFNGASSEAFIDGSSTATGNAGSQSLTGLTLGRFHNLSVSVTPLNGTMQELILFNSNQSTNRTGIEGSINEYYNIY